MPRIASGWSAAVQSAGERPLASSWVACWPDHPRDMDSVKPETLAPPINTLALALREYQANEGWSWRNWMLESHRHGTARDQEISAAVAEGGARLFHDAPPRGMEVPLPAANATAQLSMRQCAPFVPRNITTMIRMHTMHREPPATRAPSAPGATFATGRARDSSLLSSTIVMSEDMTGRPEPYSGYPRGFGCLRFAH